MIPGNINTDLISGAEGGYQIQRSLRFNSSDSASLSRTPASAGNRKTWTWAGWVKRSQLSSFAGDNKTLFVAGSNAFVMRLDANDGSNRMEIYSYNGSSYDFQLITTQVFRDLSAWFHVVFASDTDNATAGDRLRLYINGARVTQFSTATYPSSGFSAGAVNNTVEHRIASTSANNNLFDGYLADIHFIDGQALTPSSFTEVSATTGQLIPKAYTGTFTGNSFWLKFADNSAATATTLGKDSSGLGNNWTPNNFSVLSSYTDTFLSRKPDGTSWTNPTYAFDGTTANYADGTAGNGTVSTIRFNKPLTGVTLLEYFYDGTSTYGYNSTDVGTGPNLTGGSWVTVYSGSAITVNNVRCTSQPGNGVVRLYAIRVNGTILNNWTETDPPGCDSTVDTPSSAGTDTGVGGQVTGNYATLNPLAGAQTLANGNLDFSSNSTDSHRPSTIAMTTGKWYCEFTVSSAYGVPGLVPAGFISTYPGSTSNSWGWYGPNGVYNNGGILFSATYTGGDVVQIAFDADSGKLWFGKNGTWLNSGNPVAGTGQIATASAGAWHFAAGGSSISSVTLNANFGQRPFAYTAPSGFKALCDTNLPAPVVAKSSDYFQTVLYTGNSSSQSITGLGFSPDFVWIKERNAGSWHQLNDAVRGANKQLYTNDTSAEGTQTDRLQSFDSAGFTLGNSISGGVNNSGSSYAAWCWDAGTTTTTNTQGSITSQVRANPSAGFSVVTYTGNGSSNQTVGHGLGAAPHFIICKIRSGSDNWAVYHRSLGATGRISLNTTGAAFSGNAWDVTPTSSVFTIQTSGEVNGNGSTYVAYCFAPVAGYSAMGSYTGNGSTDGPFVFTGHRSRFVMIKCSSSAAEWRIYDAARLGYNAVSTILVPNSSQAEGTTGYPLDIVSNGFKIRAPGDDTVLNSNGATYIWVSFAENPFQYARAR